jgi:hypothetical protein
LAPPGHADRYVCAGFSAWQARRRRSPRVTGQTHMQVASGIELPATALTAAGDRPAVWIVDGKTQQVSLRTVGLLRQDSSRIVISRGGGESREIVVTAGVHALRPDQNVRLAHRSVVYFLMLAVLVLGISADAQHVVRRIQSDTPRRTRRVGRCV